MKAIKALFNTVQSDILFTDEYNEIQDNLIKLCELINEYEGLTESLWYVGEFSDCTLDELLIGAYWHFTEWHEGQDSKSYSTLCALGSVFTPNCSTLDKDSPAHNVYKCLEITAKKIIK